MTWLPVVAMGVAGALFWRRLARGGLAPLGEDETTPQGIAVFLAMMILANVIGVGLGLPLGADAYASAQLADIITLQALAFGLAVLAVMFVAGRLGVSGSSLGLRAHEGPPAPLLALAGWLAVVPFVSAANLLNRALVSADEDELQDYLERFLGEEGAAHDPFVWLCIVAAIPIAEEIIFRGALYGGLRRLLPPAVAMIVSGALFGALHDGVAMLPTATLGVALAWIYEKTGSLTTPCLVHVLQNGFTLVLATAAPEVTS